MMTLVKVIVVEGKKREWVHICFAENISGVADKEGHRARHRSMLAPSI